MISKLRSADGGVVGGGAWPFYTLVRVLCRVQRPEPPGALDNPDGARITKFPPFRMHPERHGRISRLQPEEAVPGW